jgi:hypothetical protein
MMSVISYEINTYIRVVQADDTFHDMLYFCISIGLLGTVFVHFAKNSSVSTAVLKPIINPDIYI